MSTTNDANCPSNYADICYCMQCEKFTPTCCDEHLKSCAKLCSDFKQKVQQPSIITDKQMLERIMSIFTITIALLNSEHIQLVNSPFTVSSDGNQCQVYHGIEYLAALTGQELEITVIDKEKKPDELYPYKYAFYYQGIRFIELESEPITLHPSSITTQPIETEVTIK